MDRFRKFHENMPKQALNLKEISRPELVDNVGKSYDKAYETFENMLYEADLWFESSVLSQLNAGFADPNKKHANEFERYKHIKNIVQEIEAGIKDGNDLHICKHLLTQAYYKHRIADMGSEEISITPEIIEREYKASMVEAEKYITFLADDSLPLDELESKLYNLHSILAHGTLKNDGVYDSLGLQKMFKHMEESREKIFVAPKVSDHHSIDFISSFNVDEARAELERSLSSGSITTPESVSKFMDRLSGAAVEEAPEMFAPIIDELRTINLNDVLAQADYLDAEVIKAEFDHLLDKVQSAQSMLTKLDIQEAKKHNQRMIDDDMMSAQTFYMNEELIDAFQHSLFFEQLIDTPVHTDLIDELYKDIKSPEYSLVDMPEGDRAKFGLSANNSDQETLKAIDHFSHRLNKIKGSVQNNIINVADGIDKTAFGYFDSLETRENLRSVRKKGLDKLSEFEEDKLSSIDNEDEYYWELDTGSFMIDPILSSRIVLSSFKEKMRNLSLKPGPSGNFLRPLGNITQVVNGAGKKVTNSELFDYLEGSVERVGENAFTQKGHEKMSSIRDSLGHAIDSSAIRNDVLTRMNVNDVRKRIDSSMQMMDTVNSYMEAAEQSHLDSRDRSAIVRKRELNKMMLEADKFLAHYEILQRDIEYLKKNNPEFFSKYGKFEVMSNDLIDNLKEQEKNRDMVDFYKENSLRNKVDKMNESCEKMFIKNSKFHKMYHESLSGDPSQDRKASDFRKRTEKIQKKLAEAMQKLLESIASRIPGMSANPSPG